MQEFSSPPTTTTTTTTGTPFTPATPAAPVPSRSRWAGLGLVLAAAIVVGGSGGAAAGYAVSRAVAGPDLRPAAPVAAAQPIRSVSSTGVDGVVKVVEAVGPSVVTVINYLPNGQPQSSGSGFVIDSARGYVVTNNHVVENVRDTRAGASFDVVTSDDRTLHAKLVGRDPQTDIAVLQVSDTHLVTATLADSGSVPVGAAVVAIGSPLGTFQNTVTTGIVSGKDRAIPVSRSVTLKDLVQTDAAINQGNSGGPLIWAATNEVIGMNTLVDRQNGAEGLGFAISSNTIRQITTQLIARAS